MIAGFDPFNESKSGLEDLIASEKQSGGEAASGTPQPSFNWDSFWPANYGSSQSQLSLMSSYSLFGGELAVVELKILCDKELVALT